MGPGVSNATLKELLAPGAAFPPSFFGAEHAEKMPTVMWKTKNAAMNGLKDFIVKVLYDSELWIFQKHMYFTVSAC
jgi:hypothetical protein